MQQNASQEQGVDKEDGETDGMAPVETGAPGAWTDLRENDGMVAGHRGPLARSLAMSPQWKRDRWTPRKWSSLRGRETSEEDELEGRQRDGNITHFMQRDLTVTFGQRLNQLLKELEAMPKANAARLARFLEQMLVDYKRPSPHLRHPRADGLTLGVCGG